MKLHGVPVGLLFLWMAGCGAPVSHPKSVRPAWHSDVVYQIYPRSFADSDGDGIGDLRGIEAKLDYLQRLGVDAVWLSPVYKSTQYDNGYDISDYLDIDAVFGSLSDWTRLKDGLHARGIKLIMDIVLNHSSDEHDWFRAEVALKTCEAKLARLISPQSAPSALHQAVDDLLAGTPNVTDEAPIAGAQRIIDDFRSTYDALRLPEMLSSTEQLARLLRRRLGAAGRNDTDDDFYIWSDTPNDWTSFFDGQSAWRTLNGIDAAYLAEFSPHQPDLNWRNPRVRRAAAAVLETWASRGADGFRLDVIDLIAKDPEFADAPVDDLRVMGRGSTRYTNRPEVHAYLRDLITQSLPADVRLVGELPGVGPADLQGYTNPERHELDEAFLFGHIDTDVEGTRFRGSHRLRLDDFKGALSDQQRAVDAGGGWIANYLENHDQPRSVSRFGDDQVYGAASAKLLATLLLTLTGTPYIFQGQEIGMTNTRFASIAEVHDIEALGFYAQALRDGASPVEALEAINAQARDHGRTPMQWSDRPHGGFSSVEPTYRVNANVDQINVATEQEDPRSVLAFYRDLVAARHRSDVWVHGSFTPLWHATPAIFAYQRSLGNLRHTVLLNFSSQPVDAGALAQAGRLLLTNYASEPQSARLRPYEARILTNAF